MPHANVPQAPIVALLVSFPPVTRLKLTSATIPWTPSAAALAGPCSHDLRHRQRQSLRRLAERRRRQERGHAHGVSDFADLCKPNHASQSMMNNPAMAFDFGNPMSQAQTMSSGTPQAQYPFSPDGLPAQYQQSFPQHYQQHGPPPHLFQQHPQQGHGFQGPDGRGHQNLGQAFHPHPSPARNQSAGSLGSGIPTSQPQFSPPASVPQRGPSTPTSATTPPTSGMAQSQSTPNANLAQQAQMQNAAQATRAIPQTSTPVSPQSAARERARVTVLLDINTHLLQEVVSLQAQGKAGSAPTQGQQSPTSPTSATDRNNSINNSPTDPSKPAAGKAASQEYAECMRRLQANLSYLAAIADAKKKATGALPAGPAIMIPPPHLTAVHDLYKKLNSLFPEASQSTINKAMAYASAQSGKPTANIPAQG